MGGANPVYEAAVAGYPAQAGAINQFLGSHSGQLLYAGGSIQSQGGNGDGVYSPSYTQWYNQIFATGSTQTTVGSVNLQISTIGGSPITQLIPPLTVSLYADSAGEPTGPALATNTVNSTYVYSAPFWLTVPLPAINLSPTTFYHIVVQMVGTSTNYYVWQNSNSGSGASTSPDGTTWTVQNYGMMYQVLDTSGSGLLQYIYEDGGARWSQIGYNSLGLLSSITEYTTAQTTAGNLQNTRTLTYTNGVVTGVS